MEGPIFNIGNDRILYKLNELILTNCARFDCGMDDLNDFFTNDSIAYERDLMGKTYCWLDNSNDSNNPLGTSLCGNEDMAEILRPDTIHIY